MIELLTYYVIAGALIVGAPAVFFLIAFMPALQNTKGRMVGYKDHKTYGDSSIYENTPSDNSKFYLTLNHERKRRKNQRLGSNARSHRCYGRGMPLLVKLIPGIW